MNPYPHLVVPVPITRVGYPNPCCCLAWATGGLGGLGPGGGGGAAGSGGGAGPGA